MAASAPVISTIRGKHPCCWPIGEPGTPGFRFCDDLNVEGKPYCPDHCGQAYRKLRNHQEAA
jgi:GcrA cell cycle regulator